MIHKIVKYVFFTKQFDGNSIIYNIHYKHTDIFLPVLFVSF